MTEIGFAILCADGNEICATAVIVPSGACGWNAIFVFEFVGHYCIIFLVETQNFASLNDYYFVVFETQDFASLQFPYYFGLQIRLMVLVDLR